MRRMIGRMTHRGPDGRSVWTEKQVSLGNAALHTRMPATPQPYTHRSGGFVITADLRLDNGDELRARLNLPASAGDAEIVLSAYTRWETRCVDQLVGTFAFAIWDVREQRLFCARDRIGVRPFYYHQAVNGAVVFASEIKALFASGQVSPVVRDVRVAEFLAKDAFDTEGTFFEGIRRLPPAHTLTVEASGRLRMNRYWALDPERTCPLETDDDRETRFRELFIEAVRCRLDTGRASGVLLSGGLDSSSVACIARTLKLEAGSDDLSTFSAVFPDLPPAERCRADEQRYLDALEAQGGFDMHRVPLSGTSPLHGIDRVVEHLDQPPLSCNIYLTTHIFKHARSEGIRFLLDGAEGDVTVSHGYGRLAELLLAKRWSELHVEVEKLSRRARVPVHQLFSQRLLPFVQALGAQDPLRALLHDVRPAAAMSGQSQARMVWQYVVKPSLPLTLRRTVDRMRGHQPGPDARRFPIIHRDLVRRTRLTERVEERRAAFQTRLYSERKQHWAALHLGAGSTSAILEEISHLTSMCGGERVHPFYDVRLMEYCLSLPADQKLRDGWTRSILRRAMRDILPPVIQQRSSKGDLSPNFARGLLQNDHLHALLEDGPDELYQYVDKAVLRAAIDRNDVSTQWAVGVLSAWLQRWTGSISSAPQHPEPSYQPEVNSDAAGSPNHKPYLSRP